MNVLFGTVVWLDQADIYRPGLAKRKQLSDFKGISTVTVSLYIN